MTRRVEIRDSTDRYALFLEAPTESYCECFQGQVQQRVDLQLKKFLTESSPEAGLETEDKFPDPIRQLKDRGSNLRAFGVWCQGQSYDKLLDGEFTAGAHCRDYPMLLAVLPSYKGARGYYS